MWIRGNVWVELPANGIHEYTPPCFLPILNEGDVFGITYKTVKVCLLTQPSNGKTHKEFRTYFTTTEELLKLGDWLKEQGCTHVAFEATGVYWKPVFNLLEGSFTVLVVNAQHIKAVPGRKTDVKDAGATRSA